MSGVVHLDGIRRAPYFKNELGSLPTLLFVLPNAASALIILFVISTFDCFCYRCYTALIRFTLTLGAFLCFYYTIILSYYGKEYDCADHCEAHVGRYHEGGGD